MRLPVIKITFDKFLLSWFLSGAVSIFLPLIIYGSAKAHLYRYGYNNGENQNQEEEQQGDDAYYECKWWQWGCRRNNDDNNGQQQQNDDGEPTTPWWWIFASEEDRRRREEENFNNPALVFIYVWSLVLFISILYFGYREIRERQDLYRVVSALVVFANFCLMSLFFLGGLEGGVQTEGRELEEQGFYSQFGVMMYITMFFWLIFSCVFGVLFFLRAKKTGVEKVDVDESDYVIHQPELQVTDKEPVTV